MGARGAWQRSAAEGHKSGAADTSAMETHDEGRGGASMEVALDHPHQSPTPLPLTPVSKSVDNHNCTAASIASSKPVLGKDHCLPSRASRAGRENRGAAAAKDVPAAKVEVHRRGLHARPDARRAPLPFAAPRPPRQ